MSRLDGKVALVTGGSRGMGAAIARRLASEGADVAITYVRASDQGRRTIAEVERVGRKGLAVRADSRDPLAVPAVVEQIAARFGRFDILVNNAGIFVAKSIEALTLEDYEETLAVNVRSIFLASQAAASRMGEGGRIITIGSNLAARVPGAGLSLYSLSKAALVGFTKGLARDLGPRGITVNIVQPGSTNTDMNPANGDHAGAQRNLMAIPRFAEPDDIASIVTWLASEESRFATGASFTLDGGANI